MKETTLAVDGFRVPNEMKEVWQVQLTLLKKLLSVCESNHLMVWADGGTLLGAIRHKGYIPWDDDIDMVMLRDDYDKLVKISSREFQSPFFFQTAYSETTPYPRGHAQLRMDGTTAILPYDIDKDFHQGIFIDIFPYDAVPDDENTLRQLIQKRDYLYSRIDNYANRHTSFIHYTQYKKEKREKKEVNAIGFKNYFAQLEDLLRTNKLTDNKTVSCLLFSSDLSKCRRDKEWYNKTLFVPFEDILIPVPIGYDQILTKNYGDYMTPVMAPSLHGTFTVLDPHKSYKEYLPLLRKQRKRMIWKERFQKLFKRLQ